MKASDDAYEPPKSSPLLMGILVVAIFFVIFGVTFNASPGGIKKSPLSASVQMAHAIGLALYSYANDNNQLYPDGTSSTEVCQKLLDGGYVTDPEVFYIPMPGKVKPVIGQKLKPENVSWDITEPTDLTQMKGLPVVFMTGYKIKYVSGGAAMPLVQPGPLYGFEERPPTWFERTFGLPTITYTPSAGIAAFYDSNSAKFSSVAADHTIPNFIPPDFTPDGKTYHQLTPDGVPK